MNSTKRTVVMAFLCGLMPTLAIILMASFQGTFLQAGIYSDGKNCTVTDGYMRSQMAIVEYATTGTTNAYTVTAGQSGTVFVMTDTGGGGTDEIVEFNLPDLPAAGEPALYYWFIDTDITAGADLLMNPQDTEAINGNTAGITWDLTADADGNSCGIMGNSNGWFTFAGNGTQASGS